MAHSERQPTEPLFGAEENVRELWTFQPGHGFPQAADVKRLPTHVADDVIDLEVAGKQTGCHAVNSAHSSTPVPHRDHPMGITSGVPMVIIGPLSVLIGIVCHVFFPTPDTNLGASGLILLGLSLTGAGILWLLRSS